MALHKLVNPPDVSQIHLKTVHHEFQSCVTSIQSSPQHGQHFAKLVKMTRSIANMNNPPAKTQPQKNSTSTLTSPCAANPVDPADTFALTYLLEDPTINNVGPSQPPKEPATETQLIINLPTCWSWFYHVFQRLLLLQEACNELCKGEEFKKYALSPIQWKFKEICDFFEPLRGAMGKLFRSKLATMHQMVSMYVLALHGPTLVSNHLIDNLILTIQFVNVIQCAYGLLKNMIIINLSPLQKSWHLNLKIIPRKCLSNPHLHVLQFWMHGSSWPIFK